jgi:hypothetical protein
VMPFRAVDRAWSLVADVKGAPATSPGTLPGGAAATMVGGDPGALRAEPPLGAVSGGGAGGRGGETVTRRRAFTLNERGKTGGKPPTAPAMAGVAIVTHFSWSPTVTHRLTFWPDAPVAARRAIAAATTATRFKPRLPWQKPRPRSGFGKDVDGQLAARLGHPRADR